ncbi:MAG: glycosyl hydrolase family 28-related protein, partial [Acidimicrobiales bacterium]
MSGSSLSRRRFAAIAAGTSAYAVTGAMPAAAAQSAEDHPPLPWFDVRDYGAVGDGIADDTSAIQAAVSAAGSSSPRGGIVIAPPGTYAISSRITFPTTPVDLVGAGKQQTRFLCKTTAAGLGFGDLNTGVPGAAGGETGGFWVDGAGIATYGMNVGICSNRTFYDILVTRAAVGVQLKQTQNSLFEELYI